jgi:hypothetical protein
MEHLGQYKAWFSEVCAEYEFFVEGMIWAARLARQGQSCF